MKIIVRGIGDIHPYDMALEPFTRNIYWTDATRNIINVTRVDGSSVGVVINSEHQKPRSIALHPYKGYEKINPEGVVLCFPLHI